MALLVLMCVPCLAQEFVPSTRPSLLDRYYADTFPERDTQRFFRISEQLSRTEFVRSVIRDQLGQVPPEVFDLSSYTDGLDASGRLTRGAKFGLVTGSIVYCAAELFDGDSWLYGSLGAGLGFVSAALSDIDWPGSLTYHSSTEAPWRLQMGWVSKPAYLPRGEILPAWHSGRTRSTAGAGLSWQPDPLRQDLRFDAFLDPFASERDSFGGVQFAVGF